MYRPVLVIRRCPPVREPGRMKKKNRVERREKNKKVRY